MAAPDGSDRARSVWKRSLDVLALGATVAAGVIMAQRQQRGASPSELERFGTGRGMPSTPPSRRALKFGYEIEDMSARTMTWVLIGLALWASTAAGAVIGMTAIFKSYTLSHPPLTAEQTARIVPPGPHLQTHPFAELRDQRAREVQLLNSYAWIDADHTVARIPIARAMQMSVGKSLDDGP